MRIWVPTEEVADALVGLPGLMVELVNPDDGGQPGLPASAAQVEFYVPPFFPRPASIAAMRQMPRLRVVQTMTAGIDLLRPHIPDGAVLCNARGVHNAGTAEWVVAAIGRPC